MKSVFVIGLSLLLFPLGLLHAEEEVPVPEGMELVFEEDFEGGRERWATTDEDNWKLHDHDGNTAFGIVQRRSDYQPKYRSPLSIALIKDLQLADFVMTFKVKSMLDTGGHRDCCVFFNHQDPEHFYYVHLGAKPDPHSGQIMIVNGAPRRAMTKNENRVPWDDGWHQVKLERDTQSGKIAVYFDDMDEPLMECKDTTFGEGRIGIGSFDDVNDFDDVQIYAKQ